MELNKIEELKQNFMKAAIGLKPSEKKTIAKNLRETISVTFHVWYDHTYPNGIQYTKDAIKVAIPSLSNTPVIVDNNCIGNVVRVTGISWDDEQKCCTVTGH